MKKILSLFLAAAVVLAFSACGENNKGGSSIPADSSSAAADTSSAIQTGDFTAPESYACILSISINPQFDLYLDADENVIKLHALNDDAKSFESQIDLSDNDLDDVVESIVKVAKNKGFIKGDEPTISLDLRDIKNPKVDDKDVLEDASDAVEDTARELKLSIKVKISITQYSSEPETSNPTSASTSSNKSADSSAPAQNKTSSNPKPSTSSSTQQDQQTHICIFSPASCEAPASCSCGKTSGKALGHMWQDATCKSPKTCQICKKTEGSVGEHSYKNGKCTVCGVANYLNPKTELDTSKEYVGNLKVDGDMLIGGALQFDSEAIVVVERYFNSVQTDPNQTPIVFGGKNYYSEGGGQNPHYFEITDTEIIVKGSFWGNGNQDDVTIKLMLQADRTLKVTYSKNTRFPVGAIFSANINDVLK